MWLILLNLIDLQFEAICKLVNVEFSEAILTTTLVLRVANSYLPAKGLNLAACTFPHRGCPNSPKVTSSHQWVLQPHLRFTPFTRGLGPQPSQAGMPKKKKRSSMIIITWELYEELIRLDQTPQGYPSKKKNPWTTYIVIITFRG